MNQFFVNEILQAGVGGAVVGAIFGVAALFIGILMKFFGRFFPKQNKSEIQKLIEQKKVASSESAMYHWGFIFFVLPISYLLDEQYGLIGGGVLSIIIFMRLQRRRKEIKAEIIDLEKISIEVAYPKNTQVASNEIINVPRKSIPNEISEPLLHAQKNPVEKSSELAEKDKEPQKEFSKFHTEPSIEEKEETKMSEEEAERNQLTSNSFDKAYTAIEYIPKVAEAWKQIEPLSEEFRLQFLKALEADTNQDMAALLATVLEDHRKFIRPYQSSDLNDALEQARELGDEALTEFRRIVDVLGEQIDVQHTMEKLKAKFHTPSSLKDLEMAVSQQSTEAICLALEALGHKITIKTDSYNINHYWVYEGPTLIGQHQLETFAKSVLKRA
jgi:hypothetical protein